MTTIYIVTDGSYSDYHLVAPFSTRELVEEYVKHYSGNIEEWELDPAVRYPPPGMSVYRVEMLKNGTCIRCEKGMGDQGMLDWVKWEPLLRWNEIICDHEDLYPPELVETAPDPFCHIMISRYKDAEMVVYVLARDETHAIKIANERRAMLIASGGWEQKSITKD